MDLTSRPLHRLLVVLTDAAVLAGAFLLTHRLSSGLAPTAEHLPGVLAQLPLVLAVQLLALRCCGAYSARAEASTPLAARGFALAAGGAALSFVLLPLALTRSDGPGLPVATLPALTATALGFGVILAGRGLALRRRTPGPAPLLARPEPAIEELLGRPATPVDTDGLREFVAGRRIMVTGAGGSIGSELARQIARLSPQRLVLVERAEASLFEIAHQLVPRYGGSVVPALADVGDGSKLSSLLREHRPHVVLHAAAHKHVPLLETHASEAVANNVLATRALGTLAGEHGVETFVLISTDKAVKPTSVMGATKRLAELVIADLDRRFATRYLAVRFGNVLESAGSVVPIFRRQIAMGGPVTITHPEMVRYFMTIPEASQLVLEAATLGRGGEIFVLDMGEPVRILDLARQMIRRCGLEPGVDIEIAFTGIRPGEKLREELGYEDEALVPTRDPRILAGRIQGGVFGIAPALQRLRGLAMERRDVEILELLQELLPEARLTRPDRPDAVASPAAATVAEAETVEAEAAAAPKLAFG